MLKKVAIITGITGQDGSYLAELLLERKYQVIGIMRRHSSPEVQKKRLEQAGILTNPDLTLETGDLTDHASISRLIRTYQPDEIYNLAAQSHVQVSFTQPVFTTETNAVGLLNILETVYNLGLSTKIYQASTSEMFGNVSDDDGYVRETTRMSPVSPYGCAKVYAYNIARIYRDSYDMFVCNGILLNHESPRRGLQFVSNKIVAGAVEIYKNKGGTLTLGNLDAQRDWGHAKDYVKAMHMMLQYYNPDDFLVATGVTHSVRELCQYVFSKLGMDYQQHVVTTNKYKRPNELHRLIGDATKIKEQLGWTPEYTFETLLDEMIEFKLNES